VATFLSPSVLGVANASDDTRDLAGTVRCPHPGEKYEKRKEDE